MCDVHLLAKEHAFNKYVATFEGSLSMNLNEGYLDFCGVITHLVTHHLNISTSFFSQIKSMLEISSLYL
jgi:hypothetical protein